MRIDVVGDAPSETRLAAQRALGAAARELALEPGEISLRFVELESMRALNRAWRGEDSPTDVLSFPLAEGRGEDGRHFGDIVLCLPVAERQALERGHALTRETAVLAVHGLLHLLGHDHETDEGEMDALEERLRPLVDAAAEETT